MKKKKAGMTVQQFMNLVNRKNQHEPEFIQAVQEVVENRWTILLTIIQNM